MRIHKQQTKHFLVYKDGLSFFQRDSKCISVERIDCKDTFLFLFLFYASLLREAHKKTVRQFIKKGHAHVRMFFPRPHTTKICC